MECISTPRPSISILVVEDEVITLEFLVRTLAIKYPNFQLYKAHNGKTSLELFAEHTPDIVITDINMPDMSGVQMAIRIRAIKPDTKFIAITGKSGQEACDGFEFNQLIVKPLVFGDLFAAIEKCANKVTGE